MSKVIIILQVFICFHAYSAEAKSTSKLFLEAIDSQAFTVTAIKTAILSTDSTTPDTNPEKLEPEIPEPDLTPDPTLYPPPDPYGELKYTVYVVMSIFLGISFIAFVIITQILIKKQREAEQKELLEKQLLEQELKKR